MGGIEGVEWVGVAIMAAVLLVGIIVVMSAHGDMRIETVYANNDDDEAADVMIDLIRQANWSLLVHDDGNNSPTSIYNNERVVEALRERMAKRPWLRARYLFSYRDQPLRLLDLAARYSRRMEVWYTPDRPEGDIHYKVVDFGKQVHLSIHKPEADERRYSLRTPPRWAIGTRFRISSKYRAHFKENKRPVAVAA